MLFIKIQINHGVYIKIQINHGVFKDLDTVSYFLTEIMLLFYRNADNSSFSYFLTEIMLLFYINANWFFIWNLVLNPALLFLSTLYLILNYLYVIVFAEVLIQVYFLCWIICIYLCSTYMCICSFCWMNTEIHW